jgi:hypothetical protein
MTRCAECGSTDLVGGRYFRLLAAYTATLACGCGLGANGVAAVRRFRRVVPMEEWGPLDADGGWAAAEVEEAEPGAEEQLGTSVSCPACVAAADRADWAVRAAGAAEDRLGQAPFRACLGCGADWVVV